MEKCTRRSTSGGEHISYMLSSVYTPPYVLSPCVLFLHFTWQSSQMVHFMQLSLCNSYVQSILCNQILKTDVISLGIPVTTPDTGFSTGVRRANLTLHSHSYSMTNQVM